ncbi:MULTISPECIES: Bax inhibitor-1/YccA family protein [unclassified Leucobacter]|uniref:Bax inhibitor-1/YccA family protein n=1 Tax=unclassified Leucobacter TaxID=2621730 RepID=UPI00165DD98A|nr:MULTISPECIES: Bax inhibitor-1/YccA family protein [unclassified Leucobacter]MBC9927598.1 Bax inhibitor-1/YccA family protein [Leucobacter sp. cx-169]MBC9937276.1 Bax inhibitor-1/YccA family protein [Leucobacter sp. cx-87]
MSNPALTSNPALNGKSLSAEELRRIYDQPAAQVERPGVDAAQAPAAPVILPSDDPMTMEDSIAKTAALFVTVVAFAAVGWMFLPQLMLPAAIVGLVLGLVNAFKKEPNVALIFGYAVAQGLFLGGLSSFFEAQWPGIVSQAVIGTLSVFGVTLLLFRSGKVRTSPKMTKIVLIAMVGYLVFSVLNMILMMTGAVTDPWGVRGVEVMGIPLGVIIGLLAVFLAAYSLVMDFEFIQNGVRNKVPRRYGWSAAFGLMVTLIWLYVEILRILAILRGD